MHISHCGFLDTRKMFEITPAPQIENPAFYIWFEFSATYAKFNYGIVLAITIPDTHLAE
jgi:hypothetical protein